MLSRYTVLGMILIALAAAGSSATFAYLSAKPSSAAKIPPPMTVIHFPSRSSFAPSDWNYTIGLLNPNFHYPWNFTVVIGINNTIEWINDDHFAHTVTALTVPQGASYFDSGLISPGQTYVTALTVAGSYKYDCAWHPWLAGIITVKSA